MAKQKFIEPVLPDVDEDTVLLAPGDLDTVLEEVRTTKKRKFRINRGRMCEEVLYEDGAMCILGHVMHKMGVKKADLSGVGPSDVYEYFALQHKQLPAEVESLLLSKRRRYEPLAEQATRSNSRFANRAMHINDSDRLTWPEKEEKLIAHFAKAGYELEFFGKYQ